MDCGRLRVWFLSLKEDTHFHYKAADLYSPKCEAAIQWDDRKLKIKWPKINPMIIGDKDEEAPSLF